MDLGEVARLYGANEEVLKRTLAHACLAPVEKATDGRLIAKNVWASSASS